MSASSQAGASSGEPTPSPDPEAARVAEVLERVRAGVRQRRAEVATLGGRSEEMRLALLDLKRREFLEEPTIVSPRPVIGPLVVAVRKLAFHLFVKPYLRPVVQQQNAYNHLVTGMLHKLAGGFEDLERKTEILAGRVDRLTAATGEGAAGEAAGDPGAAQG